MAAGRPAEDSELVLERDNVHVARVQQSGGAPVRLRVLLLNLETNDGRILVAPINVVDRHREAPAFTMLRSRLQQVGGKRGNSAFARQVVAEKRNGSQAGGGLQQADYAALARVSLRNPFPSCPSRSADSWHRMQRDAKGTAASRFGLIADSQSMQIPKLPS
jgi:hypothetical protein